LNILRPNDDNLLPDALVSGAASNGSKSCTNSNVLDAQPLTSGVYWQFKPWAFKCQPD
jgi:hypothetical protein